MNWVHNTEVIPNEKIKSLGLYLIIAFLGVKGCVCAGTL